jgi:hypothetical protein
MPERSTLTLRTAGLLPAVLHELAIARAGAGTGTPIAGTPVPATPAP